MSVLEKMAEKTTGLIGVCLHIEPEDEKYQICRYTLHAFYINFFKTAILAAFAFPLGLFKNVLCFMIGFALLRTFSFGAHVSQSWKCTLVGLAMYLGGSTLSSIITLPEWAMVLIFAGCFVIFFCYSPAGTEARPIFEGEHRRFKILSLAALAAVAVCAGAFPYFLPAWTGTALTMAAFCQSISILPITQRVLAGAKKPVVATPPAQLSFGDSAAAQTNVSAPLPERPTWRLRPWQVRAAATVMTVVLFVSPVIVNLCIYPIWYNEPTMPECLRQRCKEKHS